MTGKAVILTGAAGGVGKDACKTLAQKGYEVYAGVIDDWEMGIVNAIKEASQADNLHPVMLDLRNRDHIKAVVEAIESRGMILSGLLLNGAAGAIGAPFARTPIEFMEDALQTNILGNYAAIQCCLPLLEKHAGRIAIVSSATTYAPPPLTVTYVVPKCGLNALTHLLRRELRNSRIAVSLLIPEVIKDTYMAFDLHASSRKWLATLRNCAEEELSRLTYVRGKSTALKLYEYEEDPAPDFENMYEGQLNTISYGLQNGIEPAVVTRDLVRVLESKKPRAVYYQGKFSYIYLILSWLFTARGMDWILVKMGYR